MPLFYTILHKSIVIQNNSLIDILFNSLLAELPPILDIAIPQVFTYVGVIGQGWWGATIVAG